MDNEIFFLMELCKNDSSSSSSSDVSSSSSSDSDNESRNKIIRRQNFVEQTVPQYTDFEFKQYFGISRGTYKHVLDIITPVVLSVHKGGRAKVTPEKALLLTLWYMANLEPYRLISHRFNVTISCAFTIVHKVINYLYARSEEYIKWPAKNEYINISKAFEKISKLTSVIGVIGGSHVQIRKPCSDELDYKNRKGYHSVVFQAVVDNNKKFINVHSAEPGALHNKLLLQKTQLYRQISDNPGMLDSCYLIGDHSYPSLFWLLTPNDNHIENVAPNRLIFSHRHSLARIIVKQAFDMLKQRFPRLKKFENDNIEFVNKCIVVACVLHNICIDCNDMELELPTNVNATD